MVCEVFTTHLVKVDIFRILFTIAKHKASDSKSNTPKFDDISYLCVHHIVIAIVVLVLIVSDYIPSHLQVVLVTITLH